MRDLTRVELRHQLIRERNARIAADRADAWPAGLAMSQDTLDELLLDGSFEGHHLIDFEGHQFMGIPILVDGRLEPGIVQIHWPQPKEPDPDVD